MAEQSQLVDDEDTSVEDLSAGSMWRRWDPHVHLPGTLMNDQYGNTTIEQALDELASREPVIEVLGVTDYFTTRTFAAASKAWNAGHGASIRYLFPNVELRLNDATAASRGVNLHVIAAPENVEVLDGLLARLTFSYQDVEYAASDAGLINLGRAYTGNSTLDEGAARREGAKQFKVTFDQLKNLFQKDARLRESCLIGVAAGADGTSGLKAEDGGFAAYRQSLERFAHLIFSGNPNDRDFWLGIGTDDEQTLTKKYGGQKLCLHGSDAHEVAKLGKPNQDRFCWLKGDPTFDTLWQACLAPERRSAIGPTVPGTGQHGRIDAITIQDQTWFTPGTVPINTGLVAIIGPRGSGKTALADFVAVGAGSTEPFDNEASFVSRAGRLLEEQEATASWFDDTATTRPLSRAPYDSSAPRRVRYLSQQFVERLCASDGVTSELLLEIERVIFEAWPVEERQGATSFRELLEIRLSAVRAAQQEELTRLTQASEEITTERVRQKALPTKKEQRDTVAASISNLEAQVKELTGRADTKSGERHGAVSSALAERQTQLQTVDRRRTDLRTLESKVKAAITDQFPAFQHQFRNGFDHVGLTEEQWAQFLPTFSGDPAGILEVAAKAAEAEWKAIAGSPIDPTAAPKLDDVAVTDLGARTVAELTFEQTRLEKLVGLDARRAASLTNLQNQLTKARASLTKLTEEITVAEGAEARINELATERTKRYKAYFNALLTEESELKDLYAPLEEILEGFGPTVARLRLSVRRRVNLNSWVNYAERQLIDLRTAGPFRGTGGLRPIAEEALLEAWETGDADAAANAIQEFSKEHSKSLRAHAAADTKDEAAYREWERNVAKWLYGVGHISVIYSLEYDGLNVERLSPGSRGIVLLLLYLAVDQSETDPLIIDQPEENLDPKSVYTELVRLFQTASDRRQIIMVTHNANLVVNTDVDQVIVASCDALEEGKLPRLSYQSGGLENAEIRRAVCEVLEGGAEAFQQRARRLHVDAPLAPQI